ncbi:MAG: hypothetical protein IJ160_11885 [Muribaculaceae bacterium]|nr:hypothetical protein [Muribaculaceae bacterium]
MKKIYTLTLALLASMTMLAGAQSLSDTQTLWAKAITSSTASSTSQGSDMVLAQDGSIYITGSAGSVNANENILFGEDVIGTGVTTYVGTSTSGSQQFFLSKVAQDGTLLWSVYTTNGEVGTNATYLASTNDGGVIAFGKIHHTQGAEASNLEFKTSMGNSLNYEWTIDDGHRYYYAFLLKATANGEIEWLKMIEVSHEAMPSATNYSWGTPEAIYPAGIGVDDQGNIFLAGRQNLDLYVAKADGSTVTVPAHNNEGWDGDAQKSIGNTFVLKLDANGNYLNHITTGGQATQDRPLAMTMKDGRIYLMNLITGIAGTDVTLGQLAVTPTNTIASLSTACLDTNLQPIYFNLYDNTLTGSTVQTPNVRVYGNDLYLIGKAKIGFSIDGEQFATQHTRDGVIIKADASTGQLTRAYIRQVNQAGCFDAFVDKDGNLFVAGHSLLGPMKIQQLDQDLQPTDEEDLISRTSDTQCLVSDGNKLYAMVRFNQTANLYGGQIALTSNKFACMVAGFELPFDVATGVDRIVAQQNMPTHNNVYTIDGRIVKQGDTSVEGLPAGLYIAGGKKVVVH